jgi:DNA ligase-1
METLEILLNLVKKLKNTSSTLDKIDLLKAHDNNSSLKKLLFYTYHPLYQYHVTSSNCAKNKNITGKIYECFFDLLDDLRNRKITGHDAIGAVNNFCSKNKDYKEIILNVIDKDLKTRTGEKIINKAFPDLIPEFQVALSEKYDPNFVDFEKDDWYVSQKMDGARCLVFVNENGKATSYSRQGKVFTTLSVLENAIEKLGLKNKVFDGEICFVENGKENFQQIMKIIRKKDFSIKNPTYKIFDLLEYEDFYSRKSKTNFSERLEALKGVVPEKNEYLQILAQKLVKSKEELQNFYSQALKNGWEGLIIRKDSKYKGKRSKDLLKYKEFFDSEYVIEDLEFGPFRYVQENKEVEEIMLSCAIISHKKNKVRVGSGFTIEQRKDFYKNPKKILGKTVTVQYFEETQNQDGGISLRFPTFKHLHGDKREI